MATDLSSGERSRLDSALVAICKRAGLDSTGFELFHHTVNAVYRIEAAGVVVRLAIGPDAESPVTRVALAATAFADLDLPTVRLATGIDQPVNAGDAWATLWTLLPQPDGHRLAPVDLAAPLQAMHAIKAVPIELPGWDTIGKARDRAKHLGAEHEPSRLQFFNEWANNAVGFQLPDLVERLMHRCDELDSAVGAAAWTLPMSLVHGDAHPGNLLRTNGKVVLCDLDSVAIGPPEWDLVPPAHGVARYNDDPVRAAAFAEAYGFDVTGGPAWDVLRRVRDLQLVTSVLATLPARPEMADELGYRIRSVVTDDESAIWHRFK